MPPDAPPPDATLVAPPDAADARSRWIYAGVLAAALAFVYVVDDHRLNQSALDAYVVEDVEESAAVAGLKRLVRRVGFPGLGLLGLAGIAAFGPWRTRWPGTTFLCLAAFVGLDFASIVWSEDRGETARRLIVLGSLALSAAGAARALDGRRLIAVIVAVATAHLLIGIAAEVLLGTLRPWEGGYRFVGTAHPNIQALQCGVACLGAVALATWRAGGVPPAARAGLVAVAGLTLAFTILTKSRTVTAGLLFGLGLIALARGGWRVWAAGAWSGVALLAVGIGLAGLTTVDLGKIGVAAATLGRGEQLGSFTGRSVIWETVWPYIEDEPWLGYGYAAFWVEELRLAKIWDETGWPITSAHSQWLDQMLATGLVGATALALLLVTALLRATRRTVFARSDFALFAATFLVLCTLNSFMESHLFVGTRWTAWVFLAVVLRLSVFAERREDRSPIDV